MIVRRYLASDFPEIEAWGKAWGAEYLESQFPKTGFIVDGFAAYFLYQTDSTVCFLENLVSNKAADPKLRSQAVDLVTMTIISHARELGCTVAYATTDNAAVVIRALTQGAKAQAKQTLLTKHLTHP